jgi:hypothetical protein
MVWSNLNTRSMCGQPLKYVRYDQNPECILLLYGVPCLLNYNATEVQVYMDTALLCYCMIMTTWQVVRVP